MATRRRDPLVRPLAGSTPPHAPAGDAPRPRRLAALVLSLALMETIGCGGDAPAPPPSTAPTAAAPAAAIGPLRARFETSKGAFVVDLLVEGAPLSVANFCLLASRGFYDGQEWYGQSPVVRQVGRPRPEFTPGYDLPREFVPGAWFDRAGCLAMSLVSDSDASVAHGSGIFVTVKPQERWNLVYPIFGRVVEGLAVAESLQDRDRLLSVRIEGDPAPLWASMPAEVAAWRAALDRMGPVPPVARE